MKQIFTYFSFFIYLIVQAQNADKPAYALDSVLVSATTNIKMNKAYHQAKYKNTQLQSLSSMLQKNTGIFVKEYGRGMLATVSIRGTGATHTQIIWNGIPVNSILTGQTDLNTFYLSEFNHLKIIKGGNSVIFGSGSTGGALIAESPVVFEKTFEIVNNTGIGSFNSLENTIKIKTANQRLYSQINWYINQSENNYSYVGYQGNNDNAAYSSTDISSVLGYKLNDKNQFYFKQKITGVHRELARSLYMPSSSKLLTKNHRNLLGWKYQSKRFSSQTDLAYLFESYDYFYNKNNQDFSRSISNVYMLKNLSEWQFSPEKKLLAGSEFSVQEGVGNNISEQKRNIFAGFAVWQHQTGPFEYQIRLRKEFSQTWEIPLIGAINLAYQFAPKHKIRLNSSTNYRLPNFNELYWKPGGNTGLKPEKSLSIDGGYDYNAQQERFHITAFYIHSRDLIKWTPVTNQLWTPKNFENIIFSGIEISFYKNIRINSQYQLSNQLEYTYQRPVNQESNKLLPYTPNHVLQDNFKLKYHGLELNYGYRYQGKIYTTTSNTYYLPAYQIHNLYVSYPINEKWKIEGKINNLFNTYYETFPSHPQPGRNYQLIINYKIT